MEEILCKVRNTYTIPLPEIILEQLRLEPGDDFLDTVTTNNPDDILVDRWIFTKKSELDME